MRVLVVGGGAREHAIVWKAASSRRVTEIYAAPGNPGTESYATSVRLSNPADLATWAVSASIDLAIVGPEAHLAAGITDMFTARGIPTVGPTAHAARLESSKSWAKGLCVAAGIPVPRYDSFTDSRMARSFCRSLGLPVVVKADGLANGKGTIICYSTEETDAAIHDMLERGTFGSAGSRIVIEEFLTGFECSYMFFTDGESLAVMPTSQDHKPVGTGDVGPNTGGMGAYTPVAAIDRALEVSIREQVGEPLLRALASQSVSYHGIVCGNLMITADGPVVLEFNARFGDPEAELVLPLLETDLIDIAEAITDRRLSRMRLAWSGRASLCVAMAVRGYPDSPSHGDLITGFDGVDGLVGSYVFLGGTAWRKGHLVTAGGRSVVVTGTGTSLESAAASAYARVRGIRFAGEHHRTDIGFRSLGLIQR